MTKPRSQYERVKAVFQQENQNRYAAFREALRIIIPYEWRRRTVTFLRSRFGILTLIAWITSRIKKVTRAAPKKYFKRGDFYETVTLLPHIQEAEAILNRAPSRTNRARPDVICFSIVDWSFRFQRPQQLMAQFAANGHRVFYLNVSKFRSQFAYPKFAAQEIRDNLYEVQIAARVPLELFRAGVTGKDMELVLDSLDHLRRTFNINEAIGYVMIPSWGRVAMDAQQRWGWRIIYDCMDEWENFPGIKEPLLEIEKRLVEGCHMLVVTAQRLYERWRNYQRPTILARNAADFELYAELCKPNNLLEGVKHPVIGYYGAIADWFDTDLMVEIARQRPEYTFVLLGGVFEVDVSRLRELPNVRLLGQQPYETMPQYLYHFDVCIIPFKINPITEATDPVKLYEYLSGGKPVVSVKLPELEPYHEYIYTAENAIDFARKIDLSISEDNDTLIERRKSLARQHTWSDRYNEIFSNYVRTVPQASIVVVTFDNLALTKLCLESLFRNTEYPNYEVIVVDNNSTDGTRPYLRGLAKQYNNLSIILNEVNYGFAKANNQGIQKSTGDYLVLLNNDTIVPQGWLSRLLIHLRSPQVGLVGPVTNFVGNEAKIDVSYRTWAEMEDFAIDYTWRHNQQVADIHMLAMFCVTMRREVYDRAGPLDERFGIGMFEDDDYSLRVKQLGYRVICAADTFIHHFGQAAFGKLIRSGDYDSLFEENRRKYEMKWGVEWKPHQHARLRFEKHLQ